MWGNDGTVRLAHDGYETVIAKQSHHFLENSEQSNPYPAASGRPTSQASKHTFVFTQRRASSSYMINDPSSVNGIRTMSDQDCNGSSSTVVRNDPFGWDPPKLLCQNSSSIVRASAIALNLHGRLWQTMLLYNSIGPCGLCPVTSVRRGEK